MSTAQQGLTSALRQPSHSAFPWLVSCRMGTHPSGPSTLANSDVMLLTWLEQHPETLGHLVLKRFGCELPFLFKVSNCPQASRSAL